MFPKLFEENVNCPLWFLSAALLWSCSNCPACEWPLHEEVVSQAWRWVLIRNRWREVGVYVCVWESDLKNVDQSSKLVGKLDNSIHTHISCFHWTLKPEATQFRELQVTCMHVLVNLKTTEKKNIGQENESVYCSFFRNTSPYPRWWSVWPASWFQESRLINYSLIVGSDMNTFFDSSLDLINPPHIHKLYPPML